MTERSGTHSRGRNKMALGPALRRAWIGYQQRLEAEMASNGYLRRDFPDGRVLHICARPLPVTISDIGRELQISRQGASKIVRSLQEHGFVTSAPSPSDGREKIVVLTPVATEYLDAQRRAARTVERRLQADLGTEAFDALYELLHTLGDENTPRLAQFLRTKHTGSLFE